MGTRRPPSDPGSGTVSRADVTSEKRKVGGSTPPLPTASEQPRHPGSRLVGVDHPGADRGRGRRRRPDGGRHPIVRPASSGASLVRPYPWDWSGRGRWGMDLWGALGRLGIPFPAGDGRHDHDLGAHRRYRGVPGAVVARSQSSGGSNVPSPSRSGSSRRAAPPVRRQPRAAACGTGGSRSCGTWPACRTSSDENHPAWWHPPVAGKAAAACSPRTPDTRRVGARRRPDQGCSTGRSRHRCRPRSLTMGASGASLATAGRSGRW